MRGTASWATAPPTSTIPRSRLRADSTSGWCAPGPATPAGSPPTTWPIAGDRTRKVSWATSLINRVWRRCGWVAGSTGTGLVRGWITPAGSPPPQGLLLGIEHPGAAGHERGQDLQVFPRRGHGWALDPRYRVGQPLHLRGNHDQPGVLLGYGFERPAGRRDQDHPRRTSSGVRFGPVQERERLLVLHLRYSPRPDRATAGAPMRRATWATAPSATI